ncbi:MAG: flagellar protein FlaG [Desulfobulbaceae bacterium]|nr:flagellar protein FlaG [Desulfobulbaceae bacterium]
MQIEAIGTAVASPPRMNEPARQVERGREERQEPQTSSQKRRTQPEELLRQIKNITEDGLYSVRFERDSGSNSLVVKIVDSETDEVIRQIPQEELLELSKHLEELHGNLVDTVS